MMPDYTPLTDFLDASMPKIVECWKGFRKRGYQARIDGKRRAIHARSSHKSFWLQGWDRADKEIKESKQIISGIEDTGDTT